MAIISWFTGQPAVWKCVDGNVVESLIQKKSVVAIILVLFKKPRGCLTPKNIASMPPMTFLSLVNIDMVSGPSSGLVELLRIW